MPGEPLETEVQIDPAIGAVEIKITARVEDEDLALRILEQRGDQPQGRTIYFFDTPNLELFDAGLVLRARKVKGDQDDSTVKLRPVDPARIAIEWMQTAGFEIELDRIGDTGIVSAKLSAPQAEGEIDDVVAGVRPLHKLFSPDQERLIAEFGPADVGWDALTVMGPIDVCKWKAEFDDFEHAVTAERWQLPDKSALVELSIKVHPSVSSTAGAEFRAFLEHHGLDVAGDQQTKTRGALTFFTTSKGFD